MITLIMGNINRGGQPNDFGRYGEQRRGKRNSEQRLSTEMCSIVKMNFQPAGDSE